MKLLMRYQNIDRREATTVTITAESTATSTNDDADSLSSDTDSTVVIIKTITQTDGDSSSSVSATEKVSSSSHYTSSTTAASSFISASSTSNSDVGSSSTTSVEKSTSSSILSSSSSSSTNYGLAIGIPIAVVSVFGIIVFILIYLKKRMDSGITEDALKASNSLPKAKTETYPTSSVYSTHEEKTSKKHERAVLEEEPVEAFNSKPTFLKRISRLINIPDSPVEFKSPVFLRRFHLSSSRNAKNFEERSDKELPQAPPTVKRNELSEQIPHGEGEEEKAHKPSNSIYVVVKPYARRLGDELTVCIGEHVRVVRNHSDGWATVKVVDSGDVGVIPLMCVKRVPKNF